MIPIVAAIATTAMEVEAGDRKTGLEEELEELRGLFEKELIPRDVYESKVRELLDRVMDEDSPPAGAPGGDRLNDLAGVWRVRVDGLSVWAPEYTLAMTIGTVRWRVEPTGSRLSLHQAVAGLETSRLPAAVDAAHLFEEVEVHGLDVGEDLVAFEVRRQGGAFEAIRLERFSKAKVEGTYTLHDPYGGGPGSGPEYQGHLVLERVD